MQKILIVEDDPIQLEMLTKLSIPGILPGRSKKDPLWKLRRHFCRNLLRQMNISLYFYWISS